ncbi:hypothetical protein [Marinimicrococcus flavescens]|uniref:hypothetical protein n=1 Tax=Marinimicrococcus flavescens TaxID=3031815 RepID=UPI002E17402D
MTMSVMPQQAASVVSRALRLVRDRHEPADLAHAALAGLRQIRSTIGREVGYGAMRQLDDWLRECIRERSRRRFGGKAPRRTPQPALPARAGPGAVRSSTIVCDAVHTCFLLNALSPGDALLLPAAERLLDALCEGAGGPPAWPTLSDALGAEAGEIGYEPRQPEGLFRVQ